jgi:hypothetical protein
VNPIEKDPLQKRLEITNWIVLAVFLSISAVFLSNRFTLGILLGGLISILNFHWLYHNLKNVFQSLTERAKSSIMAKYYLRFILTAILLFIIITKDLVHVLGLLIGLSIVVINIVMTTIMMISKKNIVEEVK